ncbi:NAD(P)/FAD-dependent oxidoreductase [Cryptosporangium sp. NPDC051539]|uniref:NAD(P)/FAD-dependent oxidoreductase n=1 Tax=Cryptosporangium sp. NPDC051539 TaxID=3363962 RepID=UPI0037A59001
MDSRQRIVVVGAGFAGLHAAKTALRQTQGRAEVVIVNPTDYFLYLPLLPEVAAGVLEPRRITVPLLNAAKGVRLVLGEVDGIDTDEHRVYFQGPEDERGSIRYDRLILAPGSVNKLLPVPGVSDHAHGFRSIAEALYLRDHLIRQMEIASNTPDPIERASRTTFVVVGAGYTGTEVAAAGQLFTEAAMRRLPNLREARCRWLLLDLAPTVLPGLDPRLATATDEILRKRGVEVRMKTSVAQATDDGVKLSDGEFVPTRTLVWCVGVRPDPLIESLGLPTQSGRLTVDTYLSVADHPDVYAAGDSAAVPDLTRPGEITAMTAQHAQRQGVQVGKNVAASLGYGVAAEYKHHDLGFVVDLSGAKAAANPLGIPLSGFPAKIVTRGYHLLAMPGNHPRVVADWILDATFRRQVSQLGLVRGTSVPLDTASGVERPSGAH